MIDQRYKDICLSLICLLNKINYWWQKFIYVSLCYRKSPINLHLGCGNKYLEGFINIDANPFIKKEIWLDIRNGLPFKHNQIESIYSHMLFEHLYPGELISLLKECFRVLKVGCGMRVVVPNLEAGIRGYVNKDLSWVSEFPRYFKSLGGKFYSFIFCDGQHKMCFDFNLLKEILTQAGFKEVTKLKVKQSRIYSEAQLPEVAKVDEYLYVECFKKEG